MSPGLGTSGNPAQPSPGKETTDQGILPRRMGIISDIGGERGSTGETEYRSSGVNALRYSGTLPYLIGTTRGFSSSPVCPVSPTPRRTMSGSFSSGVSGLSSMSRLFSAAANC